MLFTKLKQVAIAGTLAVTLTFAATAHPASAQETSQYTPAQLQLFAFAEANGWGQAEWDSFLNWARFMDLIAGVERCEPAAIDAYIGLLWGADAPRFQRIVRRESGMNCAAKNRASTASGLTQQLDIHAWRYTRRGWDWNTARFRGIENLEIAHELFNESGFRPWALTA